MRFRVVLDGFFGHFPGAGAQVYGGPSKKAGYSKSYDTTRDTIQQNAAPVNQRGTARGGTPAKLKHPPQNGKSGTPQNGKNGTPAK